jgi:multisubunit Na+/H+ antiporter MnhG subunit
LLIWLLVMLAGASTANLIAREALRRGVRLWKQ